MFLLFFSFQYPFTWSYQEPHDTVKSKHREHNNTLECGKKKAIAFHCFTFKFSIHYYKQ